MYSQYVVQLSGLYACRRYTLCCTPLQRSADMRPCGAALRLLCRDANFCNDFSRASSTPKHAK